MESRNDLNEQECEECVNILISESYRKTESSILDPGEYNITSCSGNEEHFGEQGRYNVNWEPLNR